MSDEKAVNKIQKEKLGPVPYIAFVVMFLFFSGIMAELAKIGENWAWLGAFDFMTLVGKFGSMATLLAAMMTGHIRHKALAALPPVVVNGVMVGAALSYAAAPDAFWVSFPLIALEVAAGEAVAVYALGLPLLALLRRIPPVRDALSAKKR